VTEGVAGGPQGSSKETGGRLASNFTYLIAAQIVAKASSLGILVLLAHYMEQDAFGRYAVAVAIPMAIEAAGDLGISQAMVRSSAGQPEQLRQAFSAALPLKFGLAIAMVALSTAIALVLGLTREVVEVAIYLAMAKALESLTYFARSVFQASERMEFEAASLILDSASRILFVVYALASGFGLVGLAKALVLSAAVVLAATLFIAVKRFIGPVRLAPFPQAAPLIRAGIPLAFVWFLDVVPMRADVILIEHIGGDRAAALFSVAVRLVEPFSILPYTISVAMLPLAARHVLRAMPTLPSLFQATLKVSLALAAAGALVLAGTASVVVTTVFGPSFAEATVTTVILAVALVPLFADGLIATFVTAFYQQRRLVLAQGAGLAVNLVVAFASMPVWGIAGVAAAVLVGELTTVMTALFIVPQVRDLASPRTLRVFAAAVPAALVLGSGELIGPFGAATFALAFFVALLVALQVFDEAERRYLQASLRSLVLLLKPRSA